MRAFRAAVPRLSTARSVTAHGAGRRLGAIAIALLLAGAAWLGVAAPGPSPAAAACVQPPSPAEAVMVGRIVFVGSVTRLDNLNRWATVKVEERWAGAAGLPETVQVHGGPDADSATLQDRSYQPGRYLFVVEQGDGYLVDNACSGTVTWTDGLASFRPSGVQAYQPAAPAGPVPLDNPALVPVAALLAALVIAVIAYLLILRARRRPPDWLR